MKDYKLSILNFLTEINLKFELCKIDSKTFLPGLLLKNGILQIDIDKIVYPGDILHEAGHIAVCEPIYRAYLDGDVYRNGLLIGREHQALCGEEIAATAWSVAVVKHLKLPLELIFHQESYKGSAKNLSDAFEDNHHFGQPLLDAWEMTCPETGFPQMVSWLRETRWVHKLPNKI